MDIALNIVGPTKLSGIVTTQGNKNAALPSIAASLLLPLGASITISGAPGIRDVHSFIKIVGDLGIETSWADNGNLTLKRVRKSNIKLLSPDAVSAIRASIVLLGPITGIHKNFTLPKPGGDKIGVRPITAHITAFENLGIKINTSDKNKLKVTSSVKNKEDKIKIWMTERSVTGTEALLLHSPFMGKNKELSVYGAACEPHVFSLCSMLESMGANIDGMNSNHIKISWPNGISGSEKIHILDDDFMEATTYAIASAITKSNITIKMRDASSIFLVNKYMGWMGVKAKIDLSKNTWSIFGDKSDFIIKKEASVIKAEPWPGFPTDVMSLFVVLATQCKGTVKFIEYMYDDRFGFVQTLKDMGAYIEETPPHVIKVHGPTPLEGHEAFVRPDIRSGAALLIASLAAKGETILYDRKKVIERGYEDLPGRLRKLGAKINELSQPPIEII